MSETRISERETVVKREAPRPKLGLRYGAVKPEPQRADAAA